MRLEALPFILVTAVAAAAAAFLLTPLAMRIARATGAMDEPDAGRRIHVRPIPRGGGLAVAAAFIGVGLIALSLNDELRFFRQLRVEISREQLVALFGGAGLAAAVGYLDDRWQMSARGQFILQVGLALFAIWLGVQITSIANPVEFLFAEGVLSESSLEFDLDLVIYLVTGLWIVGMINSINFIDGLDGLSTGVALIAAVTLGAFSLTADVNNYAPMVALLCAILAGALAGFLPWNFHPARVFIGTTGVLVAGYALSVLAILGTAKVAIALLILGVPIIDTFYIIVRRLLAGHSPFTPDRGHIHHRLLDLGLSHRGAVLLIYGLTATLAVLSLVLSGAGPLYAFMGIVVGFGLLLYLLTWRSGREVALEASSYPDEGEPLAGPPTPSPDEPPVARSEASTPGSEPVGRRPSP